MISKVYTKLETTSDFNKVVSFEFKQDRGNGNIIMRQVANDDFNEYVELAGGSIIGLQYVQGIAQVVISTVGGDKQLDKASLLQDDLKAFFELEPQILKELAHVRHLLEEENNKG